MNKQTARSVLIKKRNALSPQEVQACSQKLTQQFLKMPLAHSVQHVACYLPINNEIDPRGIIEALWQAGKNSYLPVLADDKTLRFARYVRDTVLRPNRYHILEPENSTESISISDLDLVLLPLVAFDKRGHRVGMGQGYYDRTFSAEHRAVLIGLAYAWQEVDAIQADAWDVPLDQVLTDRGVV